MYTLGLAEVPFPLLKPGILIFQKHIARRIPTKCSTMAPKQGTQGSPFRPPPSGSHTEFSARSNDLYQRSLDLLHNLMGGPNLPNLKAHSGPNLLTAHNSYKELQGIIAGAFALLNHSRMAIQELMDALSK